MLLTRNQFLIILAVIIASCGAWGVVLKMFLDSSLAFKWACAWWFFGGCLVAAVIVAALEYTGVLDDHEQPIEINNNMPYIQSIENGIGRRVQDRKIKIEGEINPALTEMQKQIIEIKKAANKGIYRE